MGLPIIKIIVLFPMLLPVWEQRPPEETDIFPSPYPTEVRAEDVAIQREGLGVGNRVLRSTIYRHLREMDLPESRQLLVDSLKTETNPRLRATILQQLTLCATPPAPPGNDLDGYLRSEDADIRYWAIRLAGKLDSVPPKRLADLAGTESTFRLRSAACLALRQRGSHIPMPLVVPLWDHGDPQVRATTLAAAIRVAGAANQAARIPTTALTDEVPVRAALAEALDEAAAANAAALVPTLAKDPHATVRVLVAKSLGKRHDDAYIATLCALARDPDAEVRRQSAQSLAQFPTPASRDTLVALLGDDRTLVRREAEESLVVLHAKSPVDVAVSQRLDDPQPHARYHAFRILGRLNSRQFAQAIGTQLPSERLPINIAAAVFALGQFEAREAAAPIAALASHSDAGIRRAVATALGRLRVPATYETIRTLAFDDAVEVRQAAIISMGWIADGHAFNPTLLKVLTTVQESRMTGANHGAAAWSAARCQPLSPAIAKRLVVQGTEAIIPGPMGEMLFEPDYVLASCDFALAQMARTNPDLLPQFAAIQAIHSRAVDPNTPTGNNLLRPSAEVREYARQAKAYLAGTTIPPLPRPTTPKVYDYAEYRPREP